MLIAIQGKVLASIRIPIQPYEHRRHPSFSIHVNTETRFSFHQIGWDITCESNSHIDSVRIDVDFTLVGKATTLNGLALASSSLSLDFVVRKYSGIENQQELQKHLKKYDTARNYVETLSEKSKQLSDHRGMKNIQEGPNLKEISLVTRIQDVATNLVGHVIRINVIVPSNL
ncbi:hypothetical protein Cgig2_024372 [Carnegiea gigantea]|uniref:Uncharacterized protein n=1 Tax=Carnegiea gigantea TaxID=171969 RepID=A0A9Q1GLR2_9CARY|nr:hypothetical protein Cgig2_024372 [Carnegiea gigantea]